MHALRPPPVAVCAGVALLAVALALPLSLAAQSSPVEPTGWQSGLIDLSQGWAEHADDNLAWARPDFDSSTWTAVDLDDLGPARAGWHWFRKRINLGPDHANVSVLIQGGRGAYELYVNGERIPGANFQNGFNVYRPTEHVFDLHSVNGVFTVALRTHTPQSFISYHLPLFLGAGIGDSASIEYERSALESQRLYYALPSIFINLILVLAGLGAFALFKSQRTHPEYMFLGLYLGLIGVSNGIWIPQQAGILPTSANFLLADPLTYFFNIAQIEFTFSFAGRRVGRAWRTYEALLLAPLALIILCWAGLFSSNAYVLIEAVVIAPVAVSLPILLWRWYRGGNREAAWLIFPSLLPAAFGTLYELGTASIYFGWRRLDFLDDSIPIGPISIQGCDVSSLLFLVAICFVMFFRFARVSREQAQGEAELEAAREVQQRLVPSTLPVTEGFRIEAAYLPAQEVGGDFYQVLPESDGALIVVGDVSGKGLKAAMTGALTIGSLRTLAAEGLGPADLLARLNQQLLSTQNDGFVTCLALHLADSGAITLANAGHLAPYRNGIEIALEPGLPLGIVAEAQYSQTTLQLSPGDSLTLLTDGVVEARNTAGRLFGFESTAKISTESAGQIAETARAFGQSDDITVLTLTRLFPGPRAVAEPPQTQIPGPTAVARSSKAEHLT